MSMSRKLVQLICITFKCRKCSEATQKEYEAVYLLIWRDAYDILLNEKKITELYVNVPLRWYIYIYFYLCVNRYLYKMASGRRDYDTRMFTLQLINYEFD